MDGNKEIDSGRAEKRRAAIAVILLLGVVSLFADMVYEGARGAIGPYLGVLGASAFVVGIAFGLGELLGYSLRIFSGFLADRTRRYWLLIIVGYAMILCIPLLAFTGNWMLAMAFVMAERIGKAFRTPSRDVLLSSASKHIGRGTAFGIHEAMDQIGAIIGPLTFTAVFIIGGGYREGFAVLIVPAVICIVALLYVGSRYRRSPAMEELDEAVVEKQMPKNIPSVFWYYSLFTLLSVVAFASFPLIAYHLSVNKIIPDSQIMMLYAIAMGVDAIVALAVGKAYDKCGLLVLAVLPVVTVLIPLFAFTGYWSLAVCGIMLWGAAMGIHETVMRAAVADITNIKKRGTAYGIFNTIYGTSMFIGGAAIGFLYTFSPASIPIFVAAMVAASLPALYCVKRACTKGAWKIRVEETL